MLISEQVRAARALLGWSAQDLATEAGLGISTVQRMENRGLEASTHVNVQAVLHTLESAGIVFLASGENVDGGPGVRLKELS